MAMKRWINAERKCSSVGLKIQREEMEFDKEVELTMFEH